MRATTSEKNTAIAAVQPNCTKNLPGTPPMKAVGRKTAIQREGGGDHGQADFVGSLHAPPPYGRLAHGVEVAHDVFDLDDRVIDQDADHQGQR